MNESEKENQNPFDTISDDPHDKPRLAPRNRKSLEQEHQKIHDNIVNSVRGVKEMSNGALPGPFNAWMYAPIKLTKVLDEIGVAIRTETKDVPIILKEIAVCIVATHHKCNVAFWAHTKSALAAGLSQKIIDDLKANKIPTFEELPEASANDQKAVYEFVKTYLETKRVDDERYENLHKILGNDKAMVQLILVIAHYCGLAAQLNIFRVPSPGSSQAFSNAPSGKN